jgi:ATP-binding cassette subfamily F protein 3
LISHDRALLDAVGSRTIAVEDRTLHSYVGGWPEYLRVREERAEAEKTAKRSKPAAAAPPPKAKSSGPSKNEAARAKKLEAEIEAAEAALKQLEEELADPAAWNDPRSAAKSTARHAEAKRALEDLYARWEAVAG